MPPALIDEYDQDHLFVLNEPKDRKQAQDDEELYQDLQPISDFLFF